MRASVFAASALAVLGAGALRGAGLGVISRKHIFLLIQSICLCCVSSPTWISMMGPGMTDEVRDGSCSSLSAWCHWSGPWHSSDSPCLAPSSESRPVFIQLRTFCQDFFLQVTGTKTRSKGWKPFHVAFYSLVTDGTLNFISVQILKSRTWSLKDCGLKYLDKKLEDVPVKDLSGNRNL